MAAESLSVLTERSARAEFGLRLDQAESESMLAGIVSPVFDSNQDAESYVSAVLPKPLTLWHGKRRTFEPVAFKFDVTNESYESSASIPDAQLRRDKHGALDRHMGGLATRVSQHWNKLWVPLLETGESAVVTEDGQFYFDTNHSIGDSGTQSNDISIDISNLPSAEQGSTTDPSVGQAAWVMRNMVAQIRGFKDYHGEPLNSGAMDFVCFVPEALGAVFETAAAALMLANNQANPIAMYNIRVVCSPRSTWTDKVAMFVADGMAFIRQQEDGPNYSYLGPGTTYYELETKKHHFFGVDVTRALAFGLWQKACLATLT